MKNLSALFLVLLLALAGQLASAQTIRRVNNNGITGTNIYATVQLAHDAAAAGDIIQLEPSTVSYGNLNCTKQLSFVGPGYFLSLNQPPALQASVIPASVDQVIFNTSSGGSSMTGLTINSNVYLGASNLTFVRNSMPGSSLYVNYTTTASNLLIRQNYLNNISYNTGAATNNVLITNNIILSTANTTWRYNQLTQGTLPTVGSQSNNTANVPQATVFVLSPGSTQFDAWYKLKTGANPATGGGEGGIDIGAFGSATGYAYRLSGIPAIPAIYQLSQSVTGNTLNVNLSTRSNN